MKRTRFLECLITWMALVWLSLGGARAEQSPDIAKLQDLVEAVQTLKAKTIVEAFFWLGSPQVPPSTIFAPDTKGGGYVVIARKSHKHKSARVYYPDADWAFLRDSVKPWTVSKADVTGVFAPNQWGMAEDDLLTLRIPDRTDEFFAALLKGWRTNKDDFRCSVHWN